MPYWFIAHLPGNPDSLKLGGPLASEYEAEEAAGNLENIRVFNLNTIDRHVAAQNIKAIRLKETGDSDIALKRISHKRDGQPVDKSTSLDVQSDEKLFDDSI